MIGKRIAWLGLLAAAGLGCQAPSEDGLVEPVAESASESIWAVGCYWDCPPCNGHDCGLCVMSCPAGEFCGDRRCEADEVCCDSGCGLCAKPGDSCDRLACLQPPECSTDAHCRVTADYCVGCDCVAVALEEEVLACPGPGVQCVKDPCVGKKAICLNSRCVVE